MSNKIKATITKRFDPCTCGCQGSDSWHARTFKRVVRDVQEVPAGAPLETVTAFGHCEYTVLREGVARFPFGERRVIEVQVCELRFFNEAGEWIREPIRIEYPGASFGWHIAHNQPEEGSQA